jgi:hypothetical protein
MDSIPMLWYTQVMKTSARSIVTWIQQSIKSLATNPQYGSANKVFIELSELSGLSKSRIIKLHTGEAINPTADVIDKLVDAVKKATRKAAR